MRRAIFSAFILGFGVLPFATLLLAPLAVAETQVAEPLKPSAANQAEIVGKVVRIADGDTITVLDDEKHQFRIRLNGIDAPESGQPMGAKSKQALSEKIFSKQVVVKTHGKDKYKRIIGDVFLDNRNINFEMVADGWAWHFKKYSTDEKLAKAETAAREKKLGLWSYAESVPPWEWRDRGRGATPKPNKGGAAPQKADPPATAEADRTVYITNTGKKYHADGCKYLSKSQIPIKLSEAKAKGYTPCTVCEGESTPHEEHVKPGKKPSGTTPPSKQIFTGPRGGQYHFSKSGKKVYERKK